MAFEIIKTPAGNSIVLNGETVVEIGSVDGARASFEILNDCAFPSLTEI